MRKMLKRKKRADDFVGRIIVAGEFESGKSSVVNALLRRPLLPCNPGMIARPIIRITDGPVTRISTRSTNGAEYAPASFDGLIDDENLALCQISTPMDVLAGTEIIEIPIHYDGKITERHLSLMADADLVIWVTIASQAWRLSEKALITQLPTKARKKSILAISRTDKLHSADDLDKIETRLQQEASPYFTEIVFMQASTDYLERSIAEARIWEETGGAALASIAHELVVLPLQASE